MPYCNLMCAVDDETFSFTKATARREEEKKYFFYFEEYIYTMLMIKYFINLHTISYTDTFTRWQYDTQQRGNESYSKNNNNSAMTMKRKREREKLRNSRAFHEFVAIWNENFQRK